MDPIEFIIDILLKCAKYRYYYIFGECVRNHILGLPQTIIDVFLNDMCVTDNFTYFVKRDKRCRVQNVRMVFHEHFIKLRIINYGIIVVKFSIKQIPRLHVSNYFTFNNFKMDKHKNITVCNKLGYLTEGETFEICMRDCENREIRLMCGSVPYYIADAQAAKQALDIFSNFSGMFSQGFTLARRITKLYMPVSSTENCVVCNCFVVNSKTTYKLTCGHSCHLICMGINDKCTICNAKICIDLNLKRIRHRTLSAHSKVFVPQETIVPPPGIF